MKIAICEDNMEDREALLACVQESLDRRGIDAKIFTYADGESLLEDAKTHYFSILFLDILLPGKNGVEVALKLRRDGSHAAVVFTTVTKDYLADSYRVWAVHYLLKPLSQADVDEAISRALRVNAGSEKMLEVTVARHQEHIPYGDIYYIGAEARICNIHARTGVYRPYINIQEVAAQLSDGSFIHCHRCYIVNLSHVIGMQRDKFIMRGDVLIPIRRGAAPEMRQLYENFRFEQVSGR